MPKFEKSYKRFRECNEEKIPKFEKVRLFLKRSDKKERTFALLKESFKMSKQILLFVGGFLGFVTFVSICDLGFEHLLLRLIVMCIISGVVFTGISLLVLSKVFEEHKEELLEDLREDYVLEDEEAKKFIDAIKELDAEAVKELSNDVLDLELLDTSEKYTKLIRSLNFIDSISEKIKSSETMVYGYDNKLLDDDLVEFMAKCSKILHKIFIRDENRLTVIHHACKYADEIINFKQDLEEKVNAYTVLEEKEQNSDKNEDKQNYEEEYKKLELKMQNYSYIEKIASDICVDTLLNNINKEKTLNVYSEVLTKVKIFN